MTLTDPGWSQVVSCSQCAGICSLFPRQSGDNACRSASQQLNKVSVYKGLRHDCASSIGSDLFGGASASLHVKKRGRA